jgi:3'-phosphoadenosine 5'-phosphosulfate sulfotransferase (PAPS reductase)/FAD synthetase
MMKLDAWELYSDAMVEHDPRRVFALLSGGNDSTVLAHWAKGQMGGRLDAAVFVDTSIAAPGVREFVEDFCAEREIKLLVYETPYSEFVAMCREHGMPGPGTHLYSYVRLKERQIDALVADHKERWKDRIMLLSGARRAESVQRMGSAVPVERDGAQVWVNPLIDWSNEEMREYRERHALPTSDAAALLHRSGECNCLAYSSRGEREMLLSLWPEWFEEKFGWLERELRAAGHRYWKLGMGRSRKDGRAGRLCAGCPRLFDSDEAGVAA